LATDLTETAQAQEQSLPAQEQSAPAPAKQPETPTFKPLHRRRFLVFYALLAVVLGAAAAGVALEAGGSVTGSTAWSPWKPSGGGLGAAQSIAAHVAPLYRLPSGNQLVSVIASAPSVSNGNETIPVHYLGIRGKSQRQDQIFQVSSSNSVMYTLCGLGDACSIPTGTASVARGRLVRREALELALYTFKYVGGIQNVVAFLPPAPGATAKTPRFVVYLRKDDLESELDQPLAQSLNPKTPLPNTIRAHEVQLVDSTTETHIFSFGLAQAPTGDWILVLNPLAA
jgi:hypothetical protein